MVENIKLWFRVLYSVMKHSVEGLSLLVQRLHDEARQHEDPKKPDQYDPKHAEHLREQANKFAQAKQELRKATDDGIRDQPGDSGEEK